MMTARNQHEPPGMNFMPLISHQKTTSANNVLLACRSTGLFPPGDPFVRHLNSLEDMHPFEKHLSGMDSPYELLRKGSWVSGNAAAENGFDLRLFYRVSELIWSCLQLNA